MGGVFQFLSREAMSAFGGKADIGTSPRNGFVPENKEAARVGGLSTSGMLIPT